jgi:hypothetical protein
MRYQFSHYPNFSSAANMFVTVTSYCSLTFFTSWDGNSPHLSSVQLIYFTYCYSHPTFCNCQIACSITVSPSEKSDIKYTWMPSHVYQDVINLAVRLPLGRGPSVFMSVAIREQCTLTNNFLYVARFATLIPFLWLISWALFPDCMHETSSCLLSQWDRRGKCLYLT